MINENAFWREVMDHLPHLVMVFRIDEFDQAHLIFVNPYVNKFLGFTPKEFVLASESSGPIKQTLDNMVAEIAKRSHDIDSISPNPIIFYDRAGREHHFQYDFSLFQTKQSKTPMLSVALRRTNGELSTTARQAVGSNGAELRPVRAVELQEPMFVAKSKIMKSVLHRFNELLDQKANILLRGEKGVGKGTFLQKAVQKLADRGVMVRDLRESATQLADLFDAPSSTAIVLSEIDILNQEQQQVLKQLVNHRNKLSLSTQWLATSVSNLEAEAEAGRFDLELFYQLEFSSLLLPSLEHRRDDLEEIITTYLAKTSHVLNIPLPRIPETIVDEILNHGLSQNFNDLYRLLAEGLIACSGDHEYSLPAYFGGLIDTKKQGKDLATKSSNIKAFDQMVKEYLKMVMKQTNGKVYGKDGAAKLLKLAPTTLQSKLIKYGIK